MSKVCDDSAPKMILGTCWGTRVIAHNSLPSLGRCKESFKASSNQWLKHYMNVIHSFCSQKKKISPNFFLLTDAPSEDRNNTLSTTGILAAF